MILERKLKLPNLLEKKSFFLLGPRSTGKSTLLNHQLKGKAQIIDLLESDYFVRLSSRPQELEEMIDKQKLGIVVIDEIQKVPTLLNEVHRLIEKKGIRFLLTGSNARKLKGEWTNLLAGRAWVAHLFPLSWSEIKNFDIERYLLWGGLPQVYLSRYPAEELQAYVKTYLYEEIRAEAVVRKVPAFSRFLEVAALSSGQMLNFTEIGNDANVPPSTVREYYSALEDTLMGFMLPPWTKSKKRKAIKTGKFYFFDVGVKHALARTRQLERNSDLYGHAFEHFLAMELRAYIDYARLPEELKFWRSIHGQEVDFVVGDRVAVEVKATQKISDKHFRGMLALKEEGIFEKYYLVTQDKIERKRETIQCLHWETFLSKLWGGEII